MDWEFLQKSELFGFFHFHEVLSETIENGNTRIMLKPGGFQQFIDLEVEITHKKELSDAKLWIDRSWLGNAEHLDVFALDLIKSFILVFNPNKETEELYNIAIQIYHMRGTRDKTVYVAGKEPKLVSLEKSLLKPLNIIRDLEDSWEKTYKSLKINLKRLNHLNKMCLLVEIKCKF